MKLLFVFGLLFLALGRGLAWLFSPTRKELVSMLLGDGWPVRFFWFAAMMCLGAALLVGATFWWALS